MKDWSVAFGGQLENKFEEMSNEYKAAFEFILNMPIGINKEVLESHMFKLRANMDSLKDFQTIELLKFKDEKVDAWGK